MREIASLGVALSLLTMAAAATASICPPSHAVGVPGIGDGCSVPDGVGILFPDIGAFRSTFTPACNAHDKCYSTLGTSYGECNGAFISNMRSACRSRFNPFLRPVEFALCNDTANRYYAAVEAYASMQNPLPAIQADALQRSRQMQARVEGDICGTTPAETTLFSGGLMDQINGAFQAYAGRPPTVYEFFDAVNAGDIVNNRTGWEALLTNKAVAAASAFPPAVGYTRLGAWGAVTLAASPSLPGVSYLWRLDVGNTAGPTVAIPMYQPPYDFEWSFSGYLKATGPNGARNMVLVREWVYEYGWCARTPDMPCN